jgi:hypothetical protein
MFDKIKNGEDGEHAWVLLVAVVISSVLVIGGVYFLLKWIF